MSFPSICSNTKRLECFFRDIMSWSRSRFIWRPFLHVLQTRLNIIMIPFILLSKREEDDAILWYKSFDLDSFCVLFLLNWSMCLISVFDLFVEHLLDVSWKVSYFRMPISGCGNIGCQTFLLSRESIDTISCRFSCLRCCCIPCCKRFCVTTWGVETTSQTEKGVFKSWIRVLTNKHNKILIASDLTLIWLSLTCALKQLRSCNDSCRKTQRELSFSDRSTTV